VSGIRLNLEHRAVEPGYTAVEGGATCARGSRLDPGSGRADGTARRCSSLDRDAASQAGNRANRDALLGARAVANRRDRTHIHGHPSTHARTLEHTRANSEQDVCAEPDAHANRHRDAQTRQGALGHSQDDAHVHRPCPCHTHIPAGSHPLTVRDTHSDG
jgi:hypothetical protein